jgi:tRNA modification GTPase
LSQKLPQSTTVIDVWNKSDLAQEAALKTRRAAYSSLPRPAPACRNCVNSCWRSWAGRPRLKASFMARERHVRALHQVAEQLAKAHAQICAGHPALDLLAEDLRQAQLHLSEITGAFTPDDLLGEIFSRFCIGK